jgi:hypothetical protein
MLIDYPEASMCEIDPLSSSGYSYCPVGWDELEEDWMPKPWTPPPTFNEPASSSFDVEQAEVIVQLYILGQQPCTTVSTAATPPGKPKASRRKGKPQRAASDDDRAPLQRKGIVRNGSRNEVAKKSAGKTCRKPTVRKGMSAAEAIKAMERYQKLRRKTSRDSYSSFSQSAAFYRVFPLVFGHNGV